MSAAKDENDRLRDGTLPSDPAHGAAPMLAPPAIRAAAMARAREVSPDRRVPGDVPAETALLGALLWCGAHAPAMLSVALVRDLLERGEQFYVPAHQSIYDAILALAAKSVPAEPAAVNAELVAMGRAIRGIEYLDELVSGATETSEPHARWLAQGIRDWWVRRETMKACQELMQLVRDPAVAIETLATQTAEMATTTARSSGTDSGVRRHATVVAEVMRDLTTAAAPSFKTGFKGLDDATGGLFPGEVSILGGQTSVGKSALAAQIAYGVQAFNEGAAVLYATLEMKAKNFVRRSVAGHARVDGRRIRRQILSPIEFARVIQAGKDTAEARIYYMDSQIQTIMEIDAAAAKLSAKLAREGLRLAAIVIDHIHLLKPAKGDERPRHEQVADLSRGFNFLTERHNCHALVLCHLKAPSEKRKGESAIPKITELSESKKIADNANNVFLLHRGRDENGMFEKKPALLIGAKTREDELFTVKLDLEARFVQFHDHVCHDRSCCEVPKREEPDHDDPRTPDN